MLSFRHDSMTGMPSKSRHFQIGTHAVEMTIAKNAAGFTLLEVLLAVFIFSIVMVTVFGSFHLLFSDTAAVQEHLQAYESAQTCFARIMADLAAIQITDKFIYKPPESRDAADPYRLVCEKNNSAGGGDSPKLRFASIAHLPLSGRTAGGIAEIIYYLDGKESEKKVLRRADNHVLEPSAETSGHDPILCRNVKSIRFVFLDQDRAEHEAWNSDEEEFGFATPKTIRITLEIENETRVHPFETTVMLPVWRLKKEGVL